MRLLHIVVALTAALSLLTACGNDSTFTMPDVTGKQLDQAYDDIKAAGFDDKDAVKIDGGGVFGVVVESNWTVCSQTPAAGTTSATPPRLAIDRTCPSSPASAPSSPAPSSPPSGIPDTAPTQPITPAPATPTTPAGPTVLTAKNTPDLEKILSADYCDPSIGRFAKKYARSEIRFDGSIAAVAAHGNYTTRFDFLLAPGNDGANSTIGPAFQFNNQGTSDLNLTGRHIPSAIKPGQTYTFTATVGSFNNAQCLFELEPVETRVR